MVDAGHQAQQGAFAGTVGADHADALSVPDPEADVPERPHLEQRVARLTEHPLQKVLFHRNLVLLPDAKRQIDLIQLDGRHRRLPFREKPAVTGNR